MELNRRRFLAATASLAVAGRASANPLGLPLGIQLYVVADDMRQDAAAAVRKLAAIGYKEVEPAGFGSAGTAAALRKLLDDNGLKCPSAHLNFDLQNLNRTFDDANALGCTYATASVPRALVPADSSQPRSTMKTPFTSYEVNRLVEVMNHVGAAAKQQGLIFGAHNHTMEFTPVNGRPALYTIIEKTDPNTVRFEIDCGWAETAGVHPGDIVKAYPGRVRMLHIKDFLAVSKGAPGSPDAPKGAEIGSGIVDYRRIFADMKGKGIEHIFVEQEGPYTRMPAMQAAEVDYKYLHSLS